MHFLDECASRSDDNNACTCARSRDGPDRCRGEVTGHVDDVSLSRVLEAHRQQYRELSLCARAAEIDHRRVLSAKSPMRGVGADREGALIDGARQFLLPARPVRTNGRRGIKSLAIRHEVAIQRFITLARITMKRRREMPDPGARNLLTIEYADEGAGVRMRELAIRIRADQGGDIHHRVAHAASPGKAPGGKSLAAFFHRMASRSSGVTPITSSAHSFARPVSSVRSAPHTRRPAPTASSAWSSIPRSTPLPDRSR